jgi:hypothetical protein
MSRLDYLTGHYSRGIRRFVGVGQYLLDRKSQERSFGIQQRVEESGAFV